MPTKLITAEQLAQILDYSAEEGIFRWKAMTGSRVVPGRVAGAIQRDGYWRIKIFRRLYAAHRLAWLASHGYWPDGQIDHINRIKTDNRISNLRIVSASANAQNKIMDSKNTSGFRGVSWQAKSNKWVAQIGVNGKQKYIGLFSEKHEAYAAYLNAAKKFHTHNPLSSDGSASHSIQTRST